MSVDVAVGKVESEIQAKPEMAIVFYGHSSRRESALVRHEINSKGEFGIGEFISPEIALGKVQSVLADSVRSTSNVDSLITDDLIVDNGRALFWHVPRRIAPLWSKGIVANKTNKLQVEWPALIIGVRKDTMKLFMYAVGTNRRPNGDTRVYKLPMFNLYSTGEACQGSATIPSILERGSCEAVLDSFITTYKTHVNTRDILRASTLKRLNAKETCTKVLYKYWKEKANGGHQPKRVLMSELEPVGKLKDLIARLA